MRGRARWRRRATWAGSGTGVWRTPPSSWVRAARARRSGRARGTAVVVPGAPRSWESGRRRVPAARGPLPPAASGSPQSGCEPGRGSGCPEDPPSWLSPASGRVGDPRPGKVTLAAGSDPPPGPLPALRPGPAPAYRGPGVFDLWLLPVLNVRGFRGKSGLRRKSGRPPGRNE